MFIGLTAVIHINYQICQKKHIEKNEVYSKFDAVLNSS